MKSIFLLTLLGFSLFSYAQEDLSECFDDNKTKSYTSSIGVNATKIINGCLSLEYTRSLGDMFYFTVGGGPILFKGFSPSDEYIYPELKFEYNRGLEIGASFGLEFNNLNTRYTETVTWGLFFNQRNCSSDTSAQNRSAIGSGFTITYPIIGDWSLKSISELGFMNVKDSETTNIDYYNNQQSTYLYFYFGFAIIKHL